MIQNKQASICVKCNLLYMDNTLKKCDKCGGKLIRQGIQIVTKEGKKDEGNTRNRSTRKS